MRSLSIRVLIALSILLVPAFVYADVTVSGTTTFASLDGGPDDADHTGRKFCFRAFPDERFHVVAATSQHRNQPRADVAGAAGHENGIRHVARIEISW